MKTFVKVALVGALLCSAARLKADDANEPKQVLEKAIKAAGGKDALAKHNAVLWKEKGNFYGMGSELQYTADYAMQYPNQFMMNIHNAFKLVVNGDEGWVNAGGSTVEMNEDQLKETQEQLYAGWLTTLIPLESDEFKLEKIDGVEVEGKPTVGIQVSHKDHRDVKLYFDKETYLLAKSVHTAKAEELGGQEVSQEEILSEYKTIEGLQVPTKVKVLRDGNKYVEAEQYDLEITQSLDKSVFAKP